MIKTFLLSIILFIPSVAYPLSRRSNIENGSIAKKYAILAIAIGSLSPTFSYSKTPINNEISIIEPGVVRYPSGPGRVSYVVVSENPLKVKNRLGIKGVEISSDRVGENLVTEYERTYFFAPLMAFVRRFRFKMPPIRPFLAHMDIVKDFEISALDMEKLVTVFRAKESDVNALVATDPNVTRFGRSVFIRLERPIEVDGVMCSTLKLKGVTPKFRLFGFVNRRHRTIDNKLEVRGGQIFFGEVRTSEPFGAMGNKAFESEVKYRHLNKGQHVIATGRYKKGMNFIVYALENKDLRINRLNGNTVFVDQATSEHLSIPDEDAYVVFNMIGKRLRELHDSGYAHGMLHQMNIAPTVKIDGFGVNFRDWETCQEIGRDMAGIGYRMIDIMRVLIDLYVEANPNDLGRTKSSASMGKSYGFLRGYFGDVPEVSDFMDQLVFELITRDIIDTLKPSMFTGWHNLSKLFPNTIQILKTLTMPGDGGSASGGIDSFAEKFKIILSQA